MSTTPLDPSDCRELFRIARVYSKEWLRSGRPPPGTPHRASLLAHSAVWLRMRVEAEGAREALHLAPDLPLYLALAQLAIELSRREPSLTLEQIAGARFDALALGEPRHLGHPRELHWGQQGLLVVIGDKAEIKSPTKSEFESEVSTTGKFEINAAIKSEKYRVLTAAELTAMGEDEAAVIVGLERAMESLGHARDGWAAPDVSLYSFDAEPFSD